MRAGTERRHPGSARAPAVRIACGDDPVDHASYEPAAIHPGLDAARDDPPGPTDNER
jgi:hypothetical protein